MIKINDFIQGHMMIADIDKESNFNEFKIYS